nr:DUF3299 domain-containing protein [Hyphomonas sp. Mor2]
MTADDSRQRRCRGATAKTWIGAMAALILAACGASDTPSDQTAPPPLPEGAKTVEFEYPSARENAARDNNEAPAEPAAESAAPSSETGAPKKTVYWGIEDGEALTLMWEDLMPEGSEEDLIREYEEFYAMLDQRYAANTTTLMDAGDPYAKIEEGSELDFMPQLGTFDTVTELDGELVRIPGYVVPFDFDSKARHTELLFVPYMGACIHTPPPPPNQIIFVRADPAVKIEDIWAPYWLEGTIETEQVENELGDAAYALKMDSIEPYLTH